MKLFILFLKKRLQHLGFVLLFGLGAAIILDLIRNKFLWSLIDWWIPWNVSVKDQLLVAWTQMMPWLWLGFGIWVLIDNYHFIFSSTYNLVAFSDWSKYWLNLLATLMGFWLLLLVQIILMAVLGGVAYLLDPSGVKASFSWLLANPDWPEFFGFILMLTLFFLLAVSVFDIFIILRQQLFMTVGYYGNWLVKLLISILVAGLGMWLFWLFFTQVLKSPNSMSEVLLIQLVALAITSFGDYWLYHNVSEASLNN